MIKSTLAACKRSGMPPTHASCFQRVANRARCVIANRSVGIHATGLILESYASKGFHVKAKSCDWGPMAGFVLSDPRFSKGGISRLALETQRRRVHAAIYENHASETPVFISDRRRLELEAMGCMQRRGGTINEMVYAGNPPDGRTMLFVLQRAWNVPGAPGLQLWSVSYDASEVSMPASVQSPNRATSGRLPVMALVDPHCPMDVRRTYRAAMTADYDLWAVFPRAADFQFQGLDRRTVPGSNRFLVRAQSFAQLQDEHVGNITDRVRAIKDMLNENIRSMGYRGGNMVHHGDEAGRPEVSEVNFDFIAFIPGEAEARFVENLSDLKQFVGEVIQDYHVAFNPGWLSQLGFSATPRGALEM